MTSCHTGERPSQGDSRLTTYTADMSHMSIGNYMIAQALMRLSTTALHQKITPIRECIASLMLLAYLARLARSRCIDLTVFLDNSCDFQRLLQILRIFFGFEVPGCLEQIRETHRNHPVLIAFQHDFMVPS